MSCAIRQQRQDKCFEAVHIERVNKVRDIF